MPSDSHLRGDCHLMRSMILVTGAGGKTGQAVISALVQRGRNVRAAVRREAQCMPIYGIGASDVFVGDITNDKAVQAMVQGVEAVYHIAPNMHPAELDIGRRVIDACAPAGVTHFVYHSVLHPQTEKMPHHWQKLRVEEYLFESGLPFTILQPTAYMQNLLGNWSAIVEQGHFAMPYPVETRLSLVDLRDVAEVVAQVLGNPQHVGATYELVGTKPLSQLEVAEMLSVGLSRPVTASQTPLDQWQTQVNLPPYALQTLTLMFQYYAKYGLIGNATMLTHLLNRLPTSLNDFIRSISSVASTKT